MPSPTTSQESLKSGRGELNDAFRQRLKRNQTTHGGGGANDPHHYPVEGPITIYLAAFEGDDPTETDVITKTVTLDEGEYETIAAGDIEYRVKLYGVYMDRPENPDILNRLRVAFSIDRWIDGEWFEVEIRTALEDSLNWKDQGNTVRIALVDVPGYNPEKDFVDLIQSGLSPAEALDYWMSEIRHYSQTEWAGVRETSQQAISKNVRKAHDKLNDGTEDPEE